MKPKLILCLVLVLSGGLFGCSTAYRPSIKQEKTVLYVHFGVEGGRLLSARIHLGETIFVGGNDYLELKGHIELHDTNLVAELMGSTGQQSQSYQGNMTLEKPFFAQGGAASGGAGPPMWFVVSTSSDSREIVERVNAMMGFTNAPVNHSAAVLDSPSAITNVPNLIDPATGLPMPMKHDKQP